MPSGVINARQAATGGRTRLFHVRRDGTIQAVIRARRVGPNVELTVEGRSPFLVDPLRLVFTSRKAATAYATSVASK